MRNGRPRPALLSLSTLAIAGVVGCAGIIAALSGLCWLDYQANPPGAWLFPLALLLAWMAAYGSYLGTGKWTWGSLLIVAGVLGSLAMTIGQVRSRVGLVGRPALLVGLLAFAGGNLPLVLIVPIALVLR